MESKWPGIRDALRGFKAEAVGELTDPDLDALTNDTRVIRNRRKSEALVGNARRMLDLEKSHGSFRDYLRSHDNFEATVKDPRKQFKFLGGMGSYYFLLDHVEEVVAPHEERVESCQRKTRR